MDNKQENKNQLDELLTKVDIVDIISSFITLTKKGQSYLSLCPFHNDSNPSMHIDPKKQIYKCFACGAGGNVLKFLVNYKKITYSEAIKYLVDKYSLEVDPSLYYSAIKKPKYTEEELEILELIKKTNSFYKLELLKNINVSQEVKAFWDERGLTNDIANFFNIGYSSQGLFKTIFEKELKEKPDLLAKGGLIEPVKLKEFFYNRITFAITDSDNNIVGFSARTIDKNLKPKYINSPDNKFFQKSKILYNYYNAISNSRDDSIIITEGFFDVIALYKAGIKNSVCLMGTALTIEHLKLLDKKHVILFLDGDDAGINATIKSLELLISHNIKTSVVVNKSRKDPDEILNSSGSKFLISMINESINGLDFLYSYFKNKFNLISMQNNSLDALEGFNKDFDVFLKYTPDNIKNYYKEKFKKEFTFELQVNSEIAKNISVRENINSNYDNYYPEENGFQYMPSIPNQEDFLGESNSYSKPLLKKQNNSSFSKLDKVDVLFLYLLKHPDLVSLFIEKANQDIFDSFRVMDRDKKQEIKSEILEAIYNNTLYDNLNKFKEDYQKYDNDSYAIILNDFSSDSNDKEIIKSNFEDLYINAFRELSDNIFKNFYDKKEIISKNEKLYENKKELALTIKRIKESHDE
ncbi:DNA primase [Mycoplasma sp. Mirounga ES2805-ORL]|uniref:DNA primase n=1 Tax=Mycoplasma sp. Mirounga ES2805-ORL TaxID=754514 RepID=UPI00197BF16D|nr:DNA primase [Mycoplasma sp. Mirounga ES2805-ORL]QSF13779.1 DNA primase [Mycoplasma sp. Mirounga ES2805-ORL]